MPQTPATLMRGGSSKCWIFDARGLPEDRGRLEAMLVDVFGAADPHQLDGIGGGTSVTSKAVFVRPSLDDDADLEYLFAQVGVGECLVDWGRDCGDCATAVALWAVEELGLFTDAPTTTVRMRNINTGTELAAEVDTTAHPLPVTVPGVLGSGTGIHLTFRNPGGENTGSLWPALAHRNPLSVDGVTMTVSMIDAAAPVVIIDAHSLGISAVASESQVAQHVPMLRKVRAHAAVQMNLACSAEDSIHPVPEVGIVGPPRDYTTTLGEDIRADDYDVSVRMISESLPHPSVGLTSAVAIALASTVPDSALGEINIRESRRALSLRTEKSIRSVPLRLGTLGGVLHCEVRIQGDETEVHLHRAARRLAEAQLCLR